MNPIRRKMVSVLSEAACDQIKSLSPESSYAKELNEIEVVDVVIAREVEKVCISLLVNRLKRVNENEREKITDKLNNIAGKLIKRVENKTEPLKLSKICLELFSQL
ncbi:MAG: hypothetical protein ACYSRZ_01720 [Planctomycetota bacterium]|jgi:nucleosome binding factor SPN SPT16 subunit